MRILGIDCGSQITGYGLVESDGSVHRLIASGIIRTSASAPFCDRLLAIATRVREIIAEHRPDEAAVEDTFYSVNARSALRLSQVRGAVLLVLAEAGLPLGEYPPAEVKVTVAGSGRADKEQVAWMLRSLLQVDAQFASFDASDAVAVAICHAVHRPMGALR